MDAGDLLTIASAWLALALWAGGLASLWHGRARTGRLLYSAGLIVFIAHTACAFHFAHGWSHRDALDFTARQSESLTGVRAGWGLYLNYLFGALWAVDVARWWRLGDAAYAVDRGALKIAIRAFALFMFINAAIVFVDGPRRWIGVALLVAMAPGLRAALRRRA